MRHAAIVLLILLCLAAVGCQDSSRGDQPRPVKSMVVALGYGQKANAADEGNRRGQYGQIGPAFVFPGKIAERYVVGRADTVTCWPPVAGPA